MKRNLEQLAYAKTGIPSVREKAYLLANCHKKWYA